LIKELLFAAPLLALQSWLLLAIVGVPSDVEPELLGGSENDPIYGEAWFDGMAELFELDLGDRNWTK
jgi:hypothetical protein